MDACGAVEAHQSKMFFGPPATSQDFTSNSHPCAGDPSTTTHALGRGAALTGPGPSPGASGRRPVQ